MSSNAFKLILGIETIQVIVEVMVKADKNGQKGMVDENRTILLENQQRFIRQ